MTAHETGEKSNTSLQQIGNRVQLCGTTKATSSLSVNKHARVCVCTFLLPCSDTHLAPEWRADLGTPGGRSPATWGTGKAWTPLSTTTEPFLPAACQATLVNTQEFITLWQRVHVKWLTSAFCTVSPPLAPLWLWLKRELEPLVGEVLK